MNTSDFYPEIRREAPGVIDITLDYAIVRAARQFCAETWFVRRTFLFSTVVSQANYSIGPLANTSEECVALKAAQITLPDGITTRPLYFDEPTSFDPNNRADVPVYIGFVPYSLVTLYPLPKFNLPVRLTVIAQPIPGANVMPDELASKWFRAIADGALAWIKQQPGQPWTDLQGAVDCGVRFRSGIANAKAEAANSFQPNGARIRARPFIV